VFTSSTLRNTQHKENAMALEQSIVRRFLRFVDMRSPGECWPWTGSKTKGYGQMANGHNGSPLKANRVSWLVFVGDIPKGKWVLHRCDNGACVNPGHLEIGTQKKNMMDAAARGRLNPKSLLNLRPGAPGFHGAGPMALGELK
jgi:hypothetical protein